MTNQPACYALDEAALQMTGSGTGGGTVTDTIQTSVTSLSSVAIRIAFYTPGRWTSPVASPLVGDAPRIFFRA